VFTVPENEYGMALCLALLTQQAFWHRQSSFTTCL